MTTRYFARLIQLVGSLAAATVFAAGGGIVEVSAAANDVQMCHTTGSGTIHMISVNASAEPAHRAHGDGRPGEAIPGNETFLFDADCQPVQRQVGPPPLACPCWSNYTQASLVSLLTGVPGTHMCTRTSAFVSVTPDQGLTTKLYVTTSGFCQLRVNSQNFILGLGAADANACMAEANAVYSSISWCP